MKAPQISDAELNNPVEKRPVDERIPNRVRHSQIPVAEPQIPIKGPRNPDVDEPNQNAVRKEPPKSAEELQNAVADPPQNRVTQPPGQNRARGPELGR
jgi:hypothetical protein